MTPIRRLVVTLICGGALVPAVGAAGASAHRSGCHGAHSCPSDHATYRWQGRLCVKPSAAENDGSYTKRVTYQGLRYLCK